MATPPPFVAKYEVADWTTTASNKTASVTVATGDILVVCATSADATGTIGNITGGGLTYTLAQSIVTGSRDATYIWTAPCPSSQTFTLSLDRTAGTQRWGFVATRFGANGGIGASSQTSTGDPPSLGIATTQANSAIVWINGDWNAVDGAGRTYRTANVAATEVTYVQVGTSYTAYVAYHSDAGPAGSYTVGLTAPTGQGPAIIAVELLAPASTAPFDPIYPVSQYGSFH